MKTINLPILLYCFAYMNGLAFSALLNVVTEGASDQIVLNLKQFTPLTSILVKTLESLMDTIPERRNSINYQLIPATYVPLVTMVYNKRLNVKQILQEIQKKLEDYHDMTVTLVFEKFLNAVDKQHFKQAMTTEQIKFDEEKQSELLLQSIYLFVKKITQKCLQLFDTHQNEKLWDTSSKNFISHVKPVSGSQLRVVYSQFCFAQSEGFKPVFGKWRTTWVENQPMIGFDHFLDEKIQIEVPTEIIASETITDVKNVPIVLIIRRPRGFSFLRKKKFFNVIIDGTEIVYTDAGIYMTKVDYFWPKENYKKQIIFCGELKTTKIEDVQQILDTMAATNYAYNSPKSPDGNNEFTKVFLSLLAEAGEQEINECQKDWFSGKTIKNKKFKDSKTVHFTNLILNAHSIIKIDFQTLEIQYEPKAYAVNELLNFSHSKKCNGSVFKFGNKFFVVNKISQQLFNNQNVENP